MKTKNRSAAEPAINNELTSVCRLWIAAGEAKDERIVELERECEQLRMRVARLTRLASPRDAQGVRRTASPIPLRRRTPTMA